MSGAAGVTFGGAWIARILNFALTILAVAAGVLIYIAWRLS